MNSLYTAAIISMIFAHCCWCVEPEIDSGYSDGQASDVQDTEHKNRKSSLAYYTEDVDGVVLEFYNEENRDGRTFVPVPAHHSLLACSSGNGLCYRYISREIRLLIRGVLVAGIQLSSDGRIVIEDACVVCSHKAVEFDAASIEDSTDPPGSPEADILAASDVMFRLGDSWLLDGKSLNRLVEFDMREAVFDNDEDSGLLRDLRSLLPVLPPDAPSDTTTPSQPPEPTQ